MKKSGGVLLVIVVYILSGGSARAADVPLVLEMGHGVKMDLIQVARGTFRQGSPSGEFRRSDDETPRQVTLTRDFHIGRSPVTRGQFARFVADTSYTTEAERGSSGGFGWDGTKLTQAKHYHWRNPGFPQTDDHPVTLITWDDAQAFCAWLSRKQGRKFQLPSEAEWEYACRAGSQTAWHNGDDPQQAAAVVWFKPAAGNSTHPAGSLKPNLWGLHIGGNVHEWCRDWYAPYGAGPVSDPEQTNSTLSDKPRRVLRGGSWNREVQHTRSAARYRNTPASRNADNGFRVLSYVNPPAQPIQAEAPETSALKTDPPGNLGIGAFPAAPEPLRAAGVGWPVLGISDFFFPGAFSLLFCILPIAVLIFVIILLLKPSQKRNVSLDASSPFSQPPGPQEGMPRRIRTTSRPVRRRVADGFWLEPGTGLPGSIVSYSYWIDGQEETGQVVFSPSADGQFIYTGAQPEQAVISNVSSPGAVPPSPPVAPQAETNLSEGAGFAASLATHHSHSHRPPAY